jgi:hypothetical protein
MAEFGRRVGTSVKQRYMLSVMCGRSTYKLTWEEIVAAIPTHVGPTGAEYAGALQRLPNNNH